MPNYDSTYHDPPVPVAMARLRNPTTGVMLDDVLMIIDTGADATFIPRRVVEALALHPVAGKYFEVSGYDGTISTSPIVEVEIWIEQRKFRGPYLVIDQEFGYLGRNILNLLRLEFNGPALAWDILPSQRKV